MSNNNIPYNLRSNNGTGNTNGDGNQNNPNQIQSGTTELPSGTIIRDGTDPNSNDRSIHDTISESQFDRLGLTLINLMEDRFKQMQLVFDQRLVTLNPPITIDPVNPSQSHQNISQAEDSQSGPTIIGNNANQHFNSNNSQPNADSLASPVNGSSRANTTILNTPNSSHSTGSINNINRGLNPNQLSFNDPRSFPSINNGRPPSMNQVLQIG